ncbi:hypothetical protein HZS55_17290 [Halosimplex rubrum]|uniref:DUF5673 domain-containing protein n=1 Tax=Halosimplex rubrum TaxID=869889 RepID=A0A7D5PBE4_9EURY|nr:hypothetical protein [Halosimplex rubrum]QLH78940.1 hypothetical protein HZS55_17290 [Halosimplex rubrum]
MTETTVREGIAYAERETGEMKLGLYLFALGGDGGSMYWLFPAMVSVWVPLLADSDGKEVAIADQGLRVERQVHDWTTVDGDELTDDALTLTRPKWYHADLPFDRSDVADLDAVTATLDGAPRQN